ncbi:sulfate ABC transporter permease subunit CysT [Arenimonas oryziterrae]|uniref:sulfate ABC transporter permease subunit CysT n=1 Tax=Arenimonas oryziterrae TaxID=498055 RepID=UPI001B7F8E12|nr:sulfate ABC transporter permease subunit CysT [Arenimonas oryziterrae]
MPGLGLTLGLSLTWLSLIVLIPLAALLLKAAGVGPAGWWAIISDARVFAALKLSFGTALLAAFIDTFIGALIAWVLVRYRFPGRRVFDAFIDLPFALPTAVAGIALTAIYAGNGWIGQWLALVGIKVAYAPAGIVMALLFIGLPFTVRTVQPVLETLHVEHEEAAASLGASRFTTLWRVLLPQVLPAMLTGFALAFARGVGEYGSVIFIAGNLPYVSEIAPLLVVIKLEEFDYGGATVIATLMLATSFLILFLINLLQRRLARGQSH